jgi:hypothetical protein
MALLIIGILVAVWALVAIAVVALCLVSARSDRAAELHERDSRIRARRLVRKAPLTGR